MIVFTIIALMLLFRGVSFRLRIIRFFPTFWRWWDNLLLLSFVRAWLCIKNLGDSSFSFFPGLYLTSFSTFSLGLGHSWLVK